MQLFKAHVSNVRKHTRKKKKYSTTSEKDPRPPSSSAHGLSLPRRPSPNAARPSNLPPSAVATASTPPSSNPPSPPPRSTPTCHRSRDRHACDPAASGRATHRPHPASPRRRTSGRPPPNRAQGAWWPPRRGIDRPIHVERQGRVWNGATTDRGAERPLELATQERPRRRDTPASGRAQMDVLRTRGRRKPAEMRRDRYARLRPELSSRRQARRAKGTGQEASDREMRQEETARRGWGRTGCSGWRGRRRERAGVEGVRGCGRERSATGPMERGAEEAWRMAGPGRGGWDVAKAECGAVGLADGEGLDRRVVSEAGGLLVLAASFEKERVEAAAERVLDAVGEEGEEDDDVIQDQIHFLFKLLPPLGGKREGMTGEGW
ncbi:uncharacterized protein A4U43_C09F15260 [Asparagus officinalis]|uniref:Uncharacterized protein n=1 Tax=Asparagus officinalis TaxID=4686 RepID=A0A5P1E7V0_ASPOF|nr:uncharacterized protein A4U43_C09F15260 [Asparagus officinalis]